MFNSHIRIPQTRREFLTRSGAGFGAVALAGMLGDRISRADSSINPMLAKTPHFPATAKRVIFLFMEGGPSHLDLFDRKPLLNQLAGQTIPDSFGKVVTAFGETKSPLLASQRKWSRNGESGIEISDWMPLTAQYADDMAIIRSC